MTITCDIRFPYNRSQEFYCGEKLELSVELRCHRETAVRGIMLCITCRNQRRNNDSSYSYYIDDGKDEDSSKRLDDVIRDSRTEIDLLGNNEEPLTLYPGTYMFNLTCHLPDPIQEQHCDEFSQEDFNFSVKIRRLLKAKRSSVFRLSVHQALVDGSGRNVCFTWPGYSRDISCSSFAYLDIRYYFAASVEDERNQRYSSDDEDESLENWLHGFVMVGDPPDEDDGEED